MPRRSFPNAYRDDRVKRPDFSLDQAIAWFLADIASEIADTTLATYRSHLHAFREWLDPKGRTLASVEPEKVEAFVRFTSKNANTGKNKMIALKSFATYLAKKKLWFAGADDARLSVLRECRAPRPSPKGQPGYSDQELRDIAMAVFDGDNKYRNRAVIAVEMHGFRGKEARSLILKNVHMPKAREIQGAIVIEEESGTKRGTGGVRHVPLEPQGRDAIVDYLRKERPEYTGTGPEPLFLTESGKPFTRNGWNSMCRRLDRMVGFKFKPHRLRSTRARQLHEAGWPDTAIMEALGWKSLAMLRRYIGTISLSQLQRYPMTLGKVFPEAI